jgi:UDP-2,3-diacylglucosamine pyrophosphatase LpxH
MIVERSFIVSDLHLGSAYFHHETFISWLDALPGGVQLVLNGDIIDDPRAPLPEEHGAVLDRLVSESRIRPVIWVYGNHDAEFELAEKGEIQFADSWAIERRLLVVHGDRLDRLMPRHGIFKWLFRRFHRLRVMFGFRNMHVAEYAKKWSLFYRMLSEHVANNALRCAREQGFGAVVCGHTHAPMDIERQGLRYFNTGSWTESPLHFLEVTPDDIILQIHEDGNG